MRTKAICTFPQYTGIFLNKESKKALLNLEPDNNLRPKYKKYFGHHVTVNFNPGKSLNVKWGALVELKIIRHIYDNYCQIIEVIPLRMTFKDGDESTTINDLSKILNYLDVKDTNRKFYITISTQGEDREGNKISHEYSQYLLTKTQNLSKSDDDNTGESDKITVIDLTDKNYCLNGFCGMYCDVIAERMQLRYNNRLDNRRNNYQNNKRPNTYRSQNYSSGRGHKGGRQNFRERKQYQLKRRPISS